MPPILALYKYPTEHKLLLSIPTFSIHVLLTWLLLEREEQEEENNLEKMLAIFKNGLVNPPKELNSPSSLDASGRIKSTEETLKDFLASHPTSGFSIGFGDKASLAYAPPQSPLMANKR